MLNLRLTLFIIIILLQKPLFAQKDTLIALVENEQLGFHYIDNHGNILIGKDKKNKHDFSDNLLRKEDKGFGFVNYKNEWVIKPQYINAGNFYENRALVEKNFVGWGYIDKKGNEVIPYKFGAGHRFSEGLAPVRINGMWGFIDTLGKLVIENKYGDFSLFKKGHTVVELPNEGYRILDRDGRIVLTIPSKFIEAGNFSEGRVRVGYYHSQGHLVWGFIDSKGTQLIASKYKSASDFSEGLARVKEERTWGYIDLVGSYIIPSQYDAAEDFINGRARVKIKGKWGIIDTTGNWIIEPMFEGLRDFENGLSAAKKDKYWGYIDLTGKWIIQPTYDTAKDFVLVKY